MSELRPIALRFQCLVDRGKYILLRRGGVLCNASKSVWGSPAYLSFADSVARSAESADTIYYNADISLIWTCRLFRN